MATDEDAAAFVTSLLRTGDIANALESTVKARMVNGNMTSVVAGVFDYLVKHTCCEGSRQYIQSSNSVHV